MLENVESIGDFSGSKLYRHLQFKKNARWNADELHEKLLEGFRDETEFSYMKGYEPWENLLVNRKSEGLNLHFPRYILNDHIHRSSAYHAFFPGKIIGHIDGEERIFFVRENF